MGSGGVDEDVIENTVGNVGLERNNVFGSGEFVAFAGLGHDVTDIGFEGVGFKDCFGDSGYEEIGDDAGVNASGAYADEIGFADSFDGTIVGTGVGGVEINALDFEMGFNDCGFTFEGGAIFHESAQGDVVGCGRNDASSDGEDFGGELESFVEVSSGLLDKPGEEEVTNAVSAEGSGTGGESVLEEVGHSLFGISEGDKAVP